MNCRDLFDFIDAYQSGELPEDQRSTFEEHIHGCPDCIEYIRQHRHTIKQAGAAFAVESSACEPCPEDLVKAVMKAVAKGASNL